MVWQDASGVQKQCPLWLGTMMTVSAESPSCFTLCHVFVTEEEWRVTMTVTKLTAALISEQVTANEMFVFPLHLSSFSHDSFSVRDTAWHCDDSCRCDTLMLDSVMSPFSGRQGKLEVNTVMDSYNEETAALTWLGTPASSAMQPYPSSHLSTTWHPNT